MNICKQFLIIASIAVPVFCFSQNSDSACVVHRSSTVKISYNSSLIYPGIRTGIELPVFTTHVVRFKNSKIHKDYYKERFLTANLGWYHQAGFHDNLYLTAGWTMRRLKSTGFFTEFSPEIGLSRTFLGGTTYAVDNNQTIRIIKNAGYYYALLSAGGGIGYDFEKTSHLPFQVFTKFNLIMIFPYNSTIYLRPAVEIGFAYKPANFLTMKVKSKSNTK